MATPGAELFTFFNCDDLRRKPHLGSALVLWFTDRTQVIAGVVAALAVLLVKGIPETAPMEISVLPALIAEILLLSLSACDT